VGRVFAGYAKLAFLDIRKIFDKNGNLKLDTPGLSISPLRSCARELAHTHPKSARADRVDHWLDRSKAGECVGELRRERRESRAQNATPARQRDSLAQPVTEAGVSETFKKGVF